jgi:hypothetical protein
LLATTPFPHVAIVSQVSENEHVLDHWFLAPTVDLEMYKVHPLRFVPNNLFHRLLSNENQSNNVEFGPLCIDQARQLYLLNDADVSLDTLPVIGMYHE